MIGISKERLVQIANETHDSDDSNMVVLSLLDMLINECKELDHWLLLEEFLKSGFQGKCWVAFKDKTVTDSIFIEGQFFESEVDSDGRRGSFRMKNIANVKPIHKPSNP